MKKLVVLAALIFSSCATMPYQPYAREVKKKPQVGGLIALHTDHRPEDRAKADSLMAANCGSDATVKVTEEGEAVVGEKTNTTQNRYRPDNTQANNGFKLGGIHFSSGNQGAEENINGSSETVQVKEWQIAYECVANEAPAPKKSKKAKAHG